MGSGRMVWWAYCYIPVHIVIEKNHFEVLKWLYENGCCLFGTASHYAGALLYVSCNAWKSRNLKVVA